MKLGVRNCETTLKEMQAVVDLFGKAAASESQGFAAFVEHTAGADTQEAVLEAAPGSPPFARDRLHRACEGRLKVVQSLERFVESAAWVKTCEALDCLTG